MPRDPAGEAHTIEWVIAALNSVEMATMPWWFLSLSAGADNPMRDWTESRLGHIERVLGEREWLAADRFTVADLLMADVLRVPAVRKVGERPATERYVERVTARPAFQKALGDQLALYSAADAARSQSPA